MTLFRPEPCDVGTFRKLSQAFAARCRELSLPAARAALKLYSGQPCLQYVELVSNSSKLNGLAWGVQPLPQSVAFNPVLGRQLASETFDQRLIRPQKSRGQFIPGIRKGIGVCHCFGHAPIDRSLPRSSALYMSDMSSLPNSSEIGSDARCLSIIDAQAPFAKLWKIYGVGVGQSPGPHG